MRTSGLLAITALALALVPSGFGTDDVAWGSPVNGLRLGAAFATDPSKPTLRVLLQNVGSEVLDVLVGHEAGSPIYDSLNFIATAPDGKKRAGLHKSVFLPTASLVLPFSVRFDAGQTRELDFPLADIIYPFGTNVTLDTLVKQGYSVRLQFEVSQGTADWADLLRPWVGMLTSAEISPAH
jgi:hypothetical protein